MMPTSNDSSSWTEEFTDYSNSSSCTNISGSSFFDDINTDDPPKPSLTSDHIRKAKLIFFWNRYPTIHKINEYFPDVAPDQENVERIHQYFSKLRRHFYRKTEEMATTLMDMHYLNQGSEMSDKKSDSSSFNSLYNYYDPSGKFERPADFLKLTDFTIKLFCSFIKEKCDGFPQWRRDIAREVAQREMVVPEWLKTHPTVFERLEVEHGIPIEARTIGVHIKYHDKVYVDLRDKDEVGDKNTNDTFSETFASEGDNVGLNGMCRSF